MATVVRRRVLVNPARKLKTRAKRNNGHRRRLSDKQVAIFGTKAQKAGLKRRRSAKRTRPAATKRRARVNSAKRTTTRKRAAAPRKRRAAPRKRTAVKTRRRSVRSNPGEIITLALNPATKRRKTSVAKRRRKASSSRRRVTRRRNPVLAAPRRRRRSVRRRNPAVSTRRRSVRRSARRNPSFGGVGSQVQSAAYAIAGAVGSKMLTQAVLGANNTGLVGYAANLGAAFALGTVAGMVTKNRNARNAIILGGVIQTLLRVLIDKTPFGSRLSLSGMGDYQVTSFVTPQTLTPGGSFNQVRNPFPQAAPVQIGKSALVA